MALLELLVFTGLLALVASKLSDLLNAPSSNGSAPLHQAGNPDKSRRVLDIEGTHAWVGDTSFLRGFGINPRFIADMRVWNAGDKDTLESAPPRVRACLKDTYYGGQSRGLESADAVTRSTSLKGKALYFVLYQPVPSVEGVLVSFVDRAR